MTDRLNPQPGRLRHLINKFSAPANNESSAGVEPEIVILLGRTPYGLKS